MNSATPNYWEVLLKLAHRAATRNEVPVAALLVHNNQIISTAHNMVETYNNPTLHAEILVLKEGFKQFGKYLTECDLYVSLEPCPMCAYAIKLSQVRRLYFGAYDPKRGGVEHGSRCLDGLNRLEVVGGFHEKEFDLLLKDFFSKKRP